MSRARRGTPGHRPSTGRAPLELTRTILSMASRRFKDANNVEWEVYDLVEPAEAPRASRPQLALDSTHFPRYRAYLVFDSANEHRRLTPIPEGWEDLPPNGLALLLGRAKVYEKS